MAAHGSHSNAGDAPLLNENVTLGAAAGPFKLGALAIGAIGVIVAVVFGFFITGDDALHSRARFYHGWLVGIGYVMSICLGGLFFTLIQHMVKVGWSVNIRRVPEALAATLPIVGLLALPLLIPVWQKAGGELYGWAVPLDSHGAHGGHAMVAPAGPLSDQFVSADDEHAAAAAREDHAHGTDQPRGEDPAHAPGTKGHDDLTGNTRASIEHGGDHHPGTHARADFKGVTELTEAKAAWLNGPFFTIRLIAYFVIWTLIGWYFYGKSKRQDVTGDAKISVHLALVAPISIILFALTATFAAFDLLMSLDHHWFSTIFGVYVFAGGMISMFATTIVTFRLLQSKGLVARSVSTEHYHDLGKFMFAFVFFWGYIGFSQFMLQWYASIPEEVAWWARRGITLAKLPINTISATSEFQPLSYVLLFGHFILPFAFLLSRHIKRSREALLAGAVWMLVMHLVDIAWLVLPEYNDGQWPSGIAVIAAIVGVIGLSTFAFLQILGGANLRPIRDPRTFESMAFVNM